MSHILAIDPGTTQSAYVIWDGVFIQSKDIMLNRDLLTMLLGAAEEWEGKLPMVIEQVRSYGMPVGASVFDTVWWSGRFCQAWGDNFFQVPRMDVKNHLCHNSRARDSNIIQALADRFAYGEKNKGKGTKKNPGFFFGFRSDVWQAFALAVTWHDRNR